MSDWNRPAPYVQPIYVQPVIVYAGRPARGVGYASLFLALLSVPMGFFVPIPILAIVLGAVGAKHQPAGRPLAIGGIVIGAFMLVCWALLALLIVVALSHPSNAPLSGYTPPAS